MISKHPRTEVSKTKQLVLDFPKLDENLEPLLPTPAIEDVSTTLSRWEYWPERQMCVVGEAGAGKTRILRKWAEDTGAAYVTGLDLGRADIDEVSNLSLKALVVDNADLCENGASLLAAMNLCKNRGAFLLFSGSTDPSSWNMSPLDLQSRLSALPVVKIASLDEKTFKIRLVSACKSRFMKLPEASADYLTLRLGRSYTVIDQIVEKLEQVADGKALNKKTAGKALKALEQQFDTD
ncbi:DNA replication ATPase [Hirschia litorea]|uniref:DNA replication ATPase n=1 Tax=Hirschia litorea TaxID=1199156 RepID=A0ABW2IIP7_9PROT